MTEITLLTLFFYGNWQQRIGLQTTTQQHPPSHTTRVGLVL